MEPMYYVSYYLELQKQLAASKGSSQKPLREVPADQELNSAPTRSSSGRCWSNRSGREEAVGNWQLLNAHCYS